MCKIRLRSQHPLVGHATVPGDKSITNRAILFCSIASGTSNIRGWLSSPETHALIQALQSLGIQITQTEDTLTIIGGTLRRSPEIINVQNSGTAMRLLAGILAGQSFSSILDGKEQLRKRPMQRIVDPLQKMGADIQCTQGRCPIYIRPSILRGCFHNEPITSAQVKSAILLAGLFAHGNTMIYENQVSRDHTERLLQKMGAPILIGTDDRCRRTISMTGPVTLDAKDIDISGDFSSSAFLLVAGAVIPDSDITISNINLNPTRMGLWDALLHMGANGEILEQHMLSGEPVGTVRMRYGRLQGIRVPEEWVGRMIDEFPIFMIAALTAEGTTLVSKAEELRFKESDRIVAMAQELAKMGIWITANPDGFSITGPQKLCGRTTVYSHNDHRVAMSLSIAGMLCQDILEIQDCNCIQASFPNYLEVLRKLGIIIESTEI